MLSKLLAEHDHIRRTLNLLEKQFLDLCRGEKPDLSIMHSIIVYIQEYPEQVHHPLEDAIFSIIVERCDGEAKIARELITDHTEIEIVTRKLRLSLDALMHGTGTEDELKSELTTFIKRQRNHLYAEEIHVYPLVKKVLTDKDWKKINSTVLRKDDPIFGERTHNDYERLYEEIEKVN